MRCKPDVASPTGCRAASCRFFVVFCRFFAVSSRLPRRPLLLSSPPTAPPVFSADRSSRLPRRPLLLSSPPSALVFSAVPSSLFPRALPLRLIILYYCAPFRSAPFRERRRSVFCPSPRPRLFPLAPCPCPFRAPFPPPRNIFFCYRTNGIRNISVNLSRKNPQSNRFQLKYLKINSYDFD